MTAPMDGPVRIAIDIGGTFTDIQLVEERTGRTHSHKTPSTPDDPAVGLITGVLEAMRDTNVQREQISGLMHGTTIATNAVLQQRFPRAALLTTAGFEDVLEIGRHVRHDIYSQIAEPRSVLIPRRLRFGVDERVDASGAALTEPDHAQIRLLAAQLRDRQVEVVALCFLNSFANPDHERRVAEWLRDELPGVPVSISVTVSPEAREYERVSTTVLNALLMPVVSGYLDALNNRLEQAGITAPVYLVQSNGGVTTPDIAAEQPVRLVLSGPSGGARAVEVLAERLNEPDLIAMDLGGTSFDVSVIRGGQANLQTQGTVDVIPVRVPMLEIRTIGAGGGSLAHVDAAGRLTVGPQSAGADPGPVAYGFGGSQPTVTDANIALGRIDPGYFLGGKIQLDQQAAVDAIQRRIADPLDLSVEVAASGIVDIAVSHMAGAIRLSLFEKGLDPRDFALVSFGGAGGLHAALVAEQLKAGKILFPPDAGTQSAWGMLFAHVVQDVSMACLCPMDPDSGGLLQQTLDDLAARADALLDRSDIEPGRRRLELVFDMRYPGQGWELTVANPVMSVNEAAMHAAATAFHQLHLDRFAHNDPSVTPELVTMRLRAIGLMDMPGEHAVQNSSPMAARERRVFIEGQWRDVTVINRTSLAAGQVVSGPVIVEDPHSTILLTGQWKAILHESGVLVATRAFHDETLVA